MSDLNDPRVFFAAERTLLAWSRTSITVMGVRFCGRAFWPSRQADASKRWRIYPREASLSG